MNIKGAIFDLDGTLLDTLESIAKSGNEMLQCFGYPAVATAQYGRFAGDGADMLVARALRYSGDASLSHLEEAKKRYREFFRTFYHYRVRPYEGIPALLEALDQQAVLLGVCTNKPHEHAVKLVQESFRENLFTHVFGQNEGFPQKPDPKALLRIIEKWNIRPEECVYLGDSDVDMQTGKGANCRTVGVLWGFREKEELLANGDDHVIAHPMDLIPLLKG